ncbi:MAG: hypothetical protein Kow00129_13400 [Thermoleophilia bacterium]
MDRVRSYFRNIRIANKIVLPFLLLLFAIVLASSWLVSHWFAGHISGETEDQLVETRRATDVLVENWENEIRNSLLRLSVDSEFLKALQAGGNSKRVLAQASRENGLDFATVSAGTQTVTVGTNIIQAQKIEGDLSPALVRTPEGWGIQYTVDLSLPGLAVPVRLSGGRLFASGFMERIPEIADKSISLAFSLNSEVIATSSELDSGLRCNGCHERQQISLAASHTSSDLLNSAEMPDGRYKLLHAPFRLGDEIAGTYTLLLRMDSIEGVQARARNVIYGAGAVLLLIFTGVGTLISRSITKPISNLAEVSEDIAAGNLAREIELGGEDEVGKLSRSVATMTENLSAQLQELGLLHQVSLTVNSSLELDYVLETLLESAIRVLGADGGSIMLLSRDGAELEVKVARGQGARDIVDETVNVDSEATAAWVVRNRRALLLPDDIEELGEPVATRAEITSSISVPIETRDAVVGVLNLNLFDPEKKFDRHTVTFVRTLGHHTAMSIDKARHHQEVNGLYTGLMQALARTIDAKDRYTYGHSEMVARYAGLIGRAMGLDSASLKGLETAAYLHDVGKIGVRDAVLTKPGRLTPIERRVVETHPLVGAQILERIVFPWPVVDAVRHHHERYDGTGYPHGLQGEEIPLQARILAVADSFDAMTSNRPYRQGRTVDEALEELVKCSGSQFDPRIISVFLEISDQVRAALHAGRQEFPQSHSARMVAL